MSSNTPDIALYDLVVPFFIQSLGNLKAFLQKAQEWNTAQGNPDSNLLEGKLAPDMFDLSFQVHVVKKMAYSSIIGPNWKFDPPASGIDTRPSDFASIYKSIDEAEAFIKSVKPADFEGGAAKPISIWPSGKEGTGPKFEFSSGLAFLRQFVIGNTGFHTTTAYNICRAKGAPLGKKDYLFSLGGPE